MREIGRLQGSIVALASPFRDGRLDEAALAVLAERQIARGTSALVVAGSTGEASMLSVSEHVRLVRVAVAVSAGRVPVIAGCTAISTEVSRFLGVAAARAGADALMLAPPPYVKPTQIGIILHMREVSRAADLPIVLYDVPQRTGVAIDDATVVALHGCGAVSGLKDATGDLRRPARLRTACGPGLALLTGEDAQAAAYRAAGGDGCVSVTANVAPFLCAQLQHCCDLGDADRIGALEALLAPLHAALFLESNPIPLKAALAQICLCAETLRAPLTPATDTTRSALRAALAPVIEKECRWQPPAPRAMRLAG